MTISDRDFERAAAVMAQTRAAGHAVAARYDSRGGRLVIELHNGVQIATPVSLIEGLANATPADLAAVEITSGGLGLHWPRLDADVHVHSVMQGLFGSPKWMAALLGAQGGRATTAIKRLAARRNGAKGGRPRKAASA